MQFTFCVSLIIFIIGIAAALFAPPVDAQISNPCAGYMSCSACVAATKVGCGWCSRPIKYANGQTGPQCAGTGAGTTPFTCPAIFSRFKCVSGYQCDQASGQCELSPAGSGVTKAECEQVCKPGTHAPAAKVYACNHATKECHVAPSGTPGAAGLPICEAECKNISTAAPGPVAKTYVCNLQNFTCQVTTPGHGTSKPNCEAMCNKSNVGYDCNTSSGQCYMVQPPAGTPKATCEAACGHHSNTPLPTLPPAPGPPPELVGVWRGVEIQNDYEIVEWDMSVNHTKVVIVQNLKSGRIVQVGTPYHKRDSPTLEFWILITEGPGTGKYYRSISDATGERGPQTVFLTMALSPVGGSAPISIDDAMTNGKDKVLAFSACIVGDKNCFFSLPNGVGLDDNDDSEEEKEGRSARAASIGSGITNKIQKVLLAAEMKLFNKNKMNNMNKVGFHDNCSKYSSTCQTCIANKNCGWCSVPVTYSGGQQGTQCAGTVTGTTPFVCQGTFSTTDCEVGYYCESGSFQCKISQPGNGMPLSQCKSMCKPTPPPNPKVPQYTCNLATHRCELCHAAHCPGSMPKGQCEELCSHPRPAPTPDMVATWRGIYIQQQYPVAEVDLVLNMTGAFMYLDGALYFSAGVTSLGADVMIWTIKTGPSALVGKRISALYQMASVDNGMYWQGTFALGLPDGGIPTGYNAPMFTKGEKELVLAKCLKAPCKFSKV